MTLAAFIFVTTETLPIGLLPQIAISVQASLPATGLLVTVYAFTVALSAVPATAATAALTRRQLLLVLLATLIVTNVAAALATSYALLLAARLVNAVAHGIFWSIVSACAVRIVPPKQRGIALAAVFGGVSIATVGGVPAGTLVGQHFGWRIAFGAVAACGAIVLAAVAWSLRDASRAPATPIAALRTLIADGPFRSLLATTILVVLGQFVAFTYIVPYVEGIAAFPAAATAPLLLLFGLAGAIGNIGAGMLANRNPEAASLATTAIIAISLVSLGISGHNHIAAVLALAGWGLGAGGLAVGLQTRVLALAPETEELASSLFAGSFNVGIGGGALLGSVIVATSGVGRAVPVGAGLALVALVVQIISRRRSRQRLRPAGTGAAGT